MKIRIYQPIDAGDLDPGMALATEDGTLIVGEVRKIVVDGGLVVDVYGLPSDGQERKQRVRRRFVVGEIVHLEPSEDDAVNAWGHVTNAVREAVDGWDDADEIPPWDTVVDRMAVTVTVGDVVYEFAPYQRVVTAVPVDDDDVF